MNSTRIARSIGALALIVTTACAVAQDDPSMHQGSLFNQINSDIGMASRKAAKKGDILMVVVNESATSNFSAATATTKTDTNVVSPTTSPLLNVVTGPILGRLLGPQASTPAALVNGIFGGGTSGATSSVAGTGSSNNTQKFTTTISVVVTQVMPNGNLVVEGQRWLRVNKELQSIVLTAMVRKDDVLSNNTVLSQNLANAKIEAEGKGQVAERQRKGIVTRILDWLF